MSKTAICPCCKKRFRIVGFEREYPDHCFTCNSAFGAVDAVLIAMGSFYGDERIKYRIKKVFYDQWLKTK